jgi:hypothetical protein
MNTSQICTPQTYPCRTCTITTKEPSLKTTTTSSDAIESSGGNLSKQNLHYPVCNQDERLLLVLLNLAHLNFDKTRSMKSKERGNLLSSKRIWLP